MRGRLAAIRHVALDMDGTIYNGSTVFEFTAQFLARLRDAGIGYTFLTNNPSRSAEDYLRKLARMGIAAGKDDLFTSAQATIDFLQTEHPDLRRLFVLGTPSMAAEFTQAGFELLPESPNAEPEAVVVGFDTGLQYERLCRAAWWIKRGKPYFATNPDRVCPTDQPTVLIDCGAICAALQSATGRAPTAVLGKPDPEMLRGILHRHRLQPTELAAVGDRLYTDIAMAHRAGALAVLVLTGEATAEEAAQFSPAPDLVVSGLREFGEYLLACRQTPPAP